MTLISGVGANVSVGGDPESCLAAWAIQIMDTGGLKHATDAPGLLTNLPGNTDWRGMYRGYYYAPLPFAGDTFAFVGSLDGLVGATGTAICTRLQIECPITEGRPIRYSVEFAAAGALSLGAAVVSTVGDGAITTAIGRSLEIDEVAVPRLRGWKLDFVGDVKEYADTTVVGQVMRRRKACLARWSYQRHIDSPATDVPTRKATNVMNFFVDTAKSWDLTWGQVLNVNKLTADKESKEMTILEVSGNLLSPVSAVEGSIVDPEGATKWPFVLGT